MSVFKTIYQDKNNELMKINWHIVILASFGGNLDYPMDLPTQSKRGKNDYMPHDPYS
jgi:hypothetical protein